MVTPESQLWGPPASPGTVSPCTASQKLNADNRNGAGASLKCGFCPGPKPSGDKATGRQNYAKNFQSPHQEFWENQEGKGLSSLRLKGSNSLTPKTSLYLFKLSSLPPSYPFFPLILLALITSPKFPINLSSLAPKTLLQGSNSTCLKAEPTWVVECKYMKKGTKCNAYLGNIFEKKKRKTHTCIILYLYTHILSPGSVTTKTEKNPPNFPQRKPITTLGQAQGLPKPLPRHKKSEF